MSDRDRAHWERFGDHVYAAGTDAFENRWP